MATKKRQSDSSVADQLYDEYYAFSFFKAVQLLESLSPEKKKLGQALVPSEEAVRFSVISSLVFPPSEISALKPADSAKPAHMEVAFLGLTGPSGVLPYWYTELVEERHNAKDDGLKDFLDLFHHRLISLFYLAWKKHKITVNYLEGARDQLSEKLLRLAGLGSETFLDRIGLPADSFAYYCGHLSKAVPSAISIASAVEHFVGTAAVVEQFVERVLMIDAEDRTAVGTSNGRLGVNAVAGSSICEAQTKFRVHLGPMSYAQYLTLLPCEGRLDSIFALIRYMVGIEYEFEVRLILKKEETPACVIGRKNVNSARLGWTAWPRKVSAAMTSDPYVTFSESDVSLKCSQHALDRRQ